MNFPEVIDLSSDEEVEVVKLQDKKPGIHFSSVEEDLLCKIVKKVSGGPAVAEKFEKVPREDSTHALCSVSEVDDLQGGLVSETSSGHRTPLCRQFWKAGDYEIEGGFQPFCQDGNNRLRVHPKFLHSNATSHKWIFGAIAELVDNAVDEIKNGATHAIVDKISIPRRGPALLIQDDGAGMDPESLRSCVSFGFSDKKSDSSIGQYGNGFKTSTMRLGADVIVFSCCINKLPGSDRWTLTQSVALLSYTFLRETSSDDIIVPMVDYEFDPSDGVSRKLIRQGEKHFSSNLFAILKWSPFATEADLLKQFDEIRQHGTRILVFNLWHNSDDVLELDFDLDKFDILTSGTSQDFRRPAKHNKPNITEQHIATCLCYSLRAYLSVLYLHLPLYFRIILRGEVVQPHSLVSDLRYIECVKYTPNVEGNKEEMITSIGFLEGSPKLNIHGFNVYHRNRLILPFWRVVNTTSSRGRGVSGVLEANFVKPTHDKQDFEKSTLYFRLEARLKEMTLEYWKYHCHLVGYPSSVIQPPVAVQGGPATPSMAIMKPVLTRPNTSSHLFTSSAKSGISSAGRIVQGPSNAHNQMGERLVLTTLHGSSCVPMLGSENGTSQIGILDKRQHEDDIISDTSSKRRSLDCEIPLVQKSACVNVPESISKLQNGQGIGKQRGDIIIMIQENKNLHLECQEREKTEKELLAKAQKLKNELAEAQRFLQMLLLESKSIDLLKTEKA